MKRSSKALLALLSMLAGTGTFSAGCGGDEDLTSGGGNPTGASGQGGANQGAGGDMSSQAGAAPSGGAADGGSNQGSGGTPAGGTAAVGGGGSTAGPVCGDTVKNGNEECDGQDFGVATCTTRKPGTKGDLVCTTSCTIDDSMCMSACGNGVVDTDIGETCDGEVTEKCADGVTPKQCANCQIDADQCPAIETCGNGVLDIDKGEVCDGDLFGDQTCATKKAGSHGSLVCQKCQQIDDTACDLTCLWDESSFDDGCVFGE